MSEVWASSLNPTDVQTAINNAVNGDTVVLPAGDNDTWTTGPGSAYTSCCYVPATKLISLRGQGSAATILRQPSGSYRFFIFNPSNSSVNQSFTLEMYGFTCVGPSGDIDAPVWPSSTGTGYAIQTKRYKYINVHDVHLHNKNFGVVTDSYGVVWDCLFKYMINNYSPSTHGSGGYGVAVKGLYGSTWPSEYPAFGTADNLFIEDCEFYGCKHGTQGADLAKYVSRHNLYHFGWSTHGQIDGHGARDTEGEASSTLQLEIYENQIGIDACSYEEGYHDYATNWRGGRALFFNNAITGSPSSYNYTLVVSDGDIDAHDEPIYSYPADYPIIWQPRGGYEWGNTYNSSPCHFYSTNADWFVSNRLSGKLDYDGQSANFTVGDKVTGQSSGANGYICKDTDSGTYGTLVLRSVSGTFQNNETILDEHSGHALVNGVLYWAYRDFQNSTQPEDYQIYDYPHPFRPGGGSSSLVGSFGGSSSVVGKSKLKRKLYGVV